MKALSEEVRLETAGIGLNRLCQAPDHWNKQPTGLAGVAIEVEDHWLRSEALPLSGTFGEIHATR